LRISWVSGQSLDVPMNWCDFLSLSIFHWQRLSTYEWENLVLYNSLALGK